MTEALVAIAAYIVGATPFGFIAGKMKGIDIREHGSGNIGATNALRILGKPIGITVFLLDFLKGFVPVFLAAHFFEGDLPPILAAIGTILGHNFTFWLKFKGGKGIATSAGALLGVLPLAVAVGLATWLVLFFTTRYVSIASIGAAVAIPIVVALTKGTSTALLVFSVVIAILAVVRHRSNIRNLLAGKEHKFERKTKQSSP